MNIASLRTPILRESAIFAVLLIFFGGIALYLDSVQSEYTQRKTAAIASANQLLSEKRTMENRFLQVKDGLHDYEESQRRAKNPGLFIDSQAVRDLFNEYQTQFFLKKITVDMQPIMDLTDAKYVRKHFLATKTSAKVVIETVSDEDVYNLIRALQKDLPGFAKITSFSLIKKLELSKEIIAEVRKQGSYPVIGAEMTFDWYGVKSTDSASPFNKYVPKKHEGETP